jgi:hypothetical protein
MTNEEIKAKELIARIYDVRRDESRVSPRWLATEAMQSLDPGRTSHPLEYAMAHLQFRQMARAVCAGRWEEGAPEEEVECQHEMFPGLQKRYPTGARTEGNDPEYVLLEHLTEKDVAFNVARLRKESRAKAKHADRLEDWWKARGAVAA